MVTSGSCGRLTNGVYYFGTILPKEISSRPQCPSATRFIFIQPYTMFNRESSPSSSDNEKHGDAHVERRGSKASVRSRIESLHELPDPDAGKSPEERAKIVCGKAPSSDNVLLTIVIG